MVADAPTIEWETPFLNPLTANHEGKTRRALIIVNQPFSMPLLRTLWQACSWRCCADGGANRLYDLLGEMGNGERLENRYIPDLIKGDLDSLREDVREHYSAKGVSIQQDSDQDSTDLMKCISTLEEIERKEGHKYEIIILGGLSGRIDHTIHVLSYVYKLRHRRSRVYVVTDDNIAWVLDRGHHRISIDHEYLGPTCGLLPVGVDSTVLSTSGLRWNLNGAESSFDGLMSTSNHLVPTEKFVTIETSRPIWWCAELRSLRSTSAQSSLPDVETHALRERKGYAIPTDDRPAVSGSEREMLMRPVALYLGYGSNGGIVGETTNEGLSAVMGTMWRNHATSGLMDNSIS